MINRFKIETQGTNTFLCCSLKKEEELDEFDYGMMRNNSIKGLMPVVLSEFDGERIIKYNITSKVTLERFLDGEISKDHFVLILKNLQEAFVNLKGYMLSTDHLILDYNNIFVDMNKMNIYMVYLPVQFEQDEQDLKQFFKDLIFRIRYKKDDDIRYIVELVNYLNSQSVFSLERFGKMLDEIQGVRREENPEKKEVQWNVPVHGHRSRDKQPDDFHVSNRVNADEEENTGKKRGFLKSRNDKETEKKKQKALKSRKNSGSSVTGFRIPGMEVPVPAESDFAEEQDEKDTEGRTDNPDKKKKSFSLFAGKKKENPAQLNMDIPQPEEKRIMSPVYPEQGYEVDEKGHLVIKEKPFIPDPQHVPYLIRSRTGEKIMLDGSVLKIGRNRKYVDYCIENNSTIGRSHADIVRTPEGYKIIDNNSKNHTYVGNVIVQSDEPVLLKHGDRIMLSDEEFFFYMN